MTLRPHQQALIADNNDKILAMWARMSGKTMIAVEMMRRKAIRGTHLMGVLNTTSKNQIITTLGEKYINKSTMGHSVLCMNKKATLYVATYDTIIRGLNNVEFDSIIFDDLCQLSENQKALVLQMAVVLSKNQVITIITTPPTKYDIICALWHESPNWSKHHYAPDMDIEKLQAYKDIICSDLVEAELLAKVPAHGH